MPEIPPLAGIATENTGWHSRHIASALADVGIDSFNFSLRDCYFTTGNSGNRTVIATAPRLPDCIIVRAIPAGTFEQITMRINILKFFHEAGIKVINSSEAISLCVDKADCLHRLAAAGVAVVPSWVSENEDIAKKIVSRESKNGASVVCKPLFGAEGRDLQIFHDDKGDFCENIRAEGVYVLQQFMNSTSQAANSSVNAPFSNFSDCRVLVIAGEAVAAMRRSSEHWVTNVARGAEVSAIDVADPVCQVAEAAAKATGADIAGVDLVEGEDGYLVLEVNSIPSWQALQSVSSTDIAARLASHVASCVYEAAAAR